MKEGHGGLASPIAKGRRLRAPLLPLSGLNLVRPAQPLHRGSAGCHRPGWRPTRAGQGITAVYGGLQGVGGAGAQPLHGGGFIPHPPNGRPKLAAMPLQVFDEQVQPPARSHTCCVLDVRAAGALIDHRPFF